MVENSYEITDSKAGITTKFHLAITFVGQVIEGFLGRGNENDIISAADLTKDVFGCFVIEDKGYDSDAHRNNLISQNNIPVIPGRKNRKIEIQYDKELYKKRSKIEILFGKIKENRRLAVRYDKFDLNFLAFIGIAFLKINLC